MAKNRNKGVRREKASVDASSLDTGNVLEDVSKKTIIKEKDNKIVVEEKVDVIKSTNLPPPTPGHISDPFVVPPDNKYEKSTTEEKVEALMTGNPQPSVEEKLAPQLASDNNIFKGDDLALPVHKMASSVPKLLEIFPALVSQASLHSSFQWRFLRIKIDGSVAVEQATPVGNMVTLEGLPQARSGVDVTDVDSILIEYIDRPYGSVINEFNELPLPERLLTLPAIPDTYPTSETSTKECIRSVAILGDLLTIAFKRIGKYSIVPKELERESLDFRANNITVEPKEMPWLMLHVGRSNNPFFNSLYSATVEKRFHGRVINHVSNALAALELHDEERLNGLRVRRRTTLAPIMPDDGILIERYGLCVATWRIQPNQLRRYYSVSLLANTRLSDSEVFANEKYALRNDRAQQNCVVLLLERSIKFRNAIQSAMIDHVSAIVTMQLRDANVIMNAFTNQIVNSFNKTTPFLASYATLLGIPAPTDLYQLLLLGTVSMYRFLKLETYLEVNAKDFFLHFVGAAAYRFCLIPAAANSPSIGFSIINSLVRTVWMLKPLLRMGLLPFLCPGGVYMPGVAEPLNLHEDVMELRPTFLTLPQPALIVGAGEALRLSRALWSLGRYLTYSTVGTIRNTLVDMKLPVSAIRVNHHVTANSIVSSPTPLQPSQEVITFTTFVTELSAMMTAFRLTTDDQTLREKAVTSIVSTEAIDRIQILMYKINCAITLASASPLFVCKLTPNTRLTPGRPETWAVNPISLGVVNDPHHVRWNHLSYIGDGVDVMPLDQVSLDPKRGFGLYMRGEALDFKVGSMFFHDAYHQGINLIAAVGRVVSVNIMCVNTFSNDRSYDAIMSQVRNLFRTNIAKWFEFTTKVSGLILRDESIGRKVIEMWDDVEVKVMANAVGPTFVGRLKCRPLIDTVFVPPSLQRLVVEAITQVFDRESTYGYCRGFLISHFKSTARAAPDTIQLPDQNLCPRVWVEPVEGPSVLLGRGVYNFTIYKIDTNVDGSTTKVVWNLPVNVPQLSTGFGAIPAVIPEGNMGMPARSNMELLDGAPMVAMNPRQEGQIFFKPLTVPSVPLNAQPLTGPIVGPNRRGHADAYQGHAAGIVRATFPNPVMVPGGVRVEEVAEPYTPLDGYDGLFIELDDWCSMQYPARKWVLETLSVYVRVYVIGRCPVRVEHVDDTHDFRSKEDIVLRCPIGYAPTVYHWRVAVSIDRHVKPVSIMHPRVIPLAFNPIVYADELIQHVPPVNDSYMGIATLHTFDLDRVWRPPQTSRHMLFDHGMNVMQDKFFEQAEPVTLVGGARV